MSAAQTSRSRRRLAVGAVALALITAACSSSDTSGSAVIESPQAEATTPANEATAGDPGESSGTAPAPAGSDGSTAAEAGAVVPEALQFTAPLVGGGEFSGAAVADKPTLFWFWAPT
jgi:hypothetical protein